MKSYTASRPTWEEKNAQIASRLQNSILTQNLSVKSAQNFMDKFVHKQGTKNGPSPSTLIEPSSYYAAPISSDTSEQPDSDNTVVTTSSSSTESTDVQSTNSGYVKPPVKTKLAGKVLASPISSGSSATAAAAKIPRGVVTATPVSTQNTAAAPQQQQQTPAQQGAINPTAISLANALKALAAAQSRAQQQQVQKKSSSSSSTTAVAQEKPTSGVNKEPVSIPSLVATTIPVSSMDKTVPISVNGPRNVPEVLKSEIKKSEEATPTQVASLVQNTVTTPTHSTGGSDKSAHELADSTMHEPSGGPQVSLNAILGTNLSPEAERLLSALITSLQPTQVSNSGQTASVSATAQSLPTTSAISSSALLFCNTVSSDQHPQGAPQYAPFPSSGTRMTTEQLVGNSDDHFINHDDDTSQLLQTSSLVDGPDLGELCDLGTFPSSSDNKRPLELPDSLFTGSAIKRPHIDTDF